MNREAKYFHHSFDYYMSLPHKRCSCGRMIFFDKAKKMICRKCNKYVFLNEKDEFKYRLGEKINANNSSNNIDNNHNNNKYNCNKSNN